MGNQEIESNPADILSEEEKERIEKEKDQKKTKKNIITAIAALILLILCGAFLICYFRDSDKTPRVLTDPPAIDTPGGEQQCLNPPCKEDPPEPPQLPCTGENCPTTISKVCMGEHCCE